MAKQLIFDYREAELDPPDRALCDYSVKLTLAPDSMREDDIGVLRQHGFDDEQIVIATQVVGYFNYINRLADALGVDDEDWMEPTLEEWEKRRGRGFENVFVV